MCFSVDQNRSNSAFQIRHNYYYCNVQSSCVTGMDKAMKDLVWIMVGLAVLGAIIALILYFGVDLPLRQAAMLVPANTDLPEAA